MIYRVKHGYIGGLDGKTEMGETLLEDKLCSTGRHPINGKVKVAKIYSNLLYKREKEPELYDAIKAVAPEW